MFGTMGRRSAGDATRSAAVKGWVAEAFVLPEGTTVMVTELACTEPGCPPIETVVAILDGPGSTRQFKVHKPIAEVDASDISGLARPGGADHHPDHLEVTR